MIFRKKLLGMVSVCQFYRQYFIAHSAFIYIWWLWTVGSNSYYVPGGTSSCCHMIKTRRLMSLRKSQTQLVEGWCFRKLQPLNNLDQPCWFYSSNDAGGQIETIYIYIYICSQRISFLFVSLSVPWRQGPDHPTASLHQSLQCKAAGQLSVRGFLYLPMAWFYEVHMEVVHPPLVGSEPPGMLALVPICCSTNPSVLASR